MSIADPRVALYTRMVSVGAPPPAASAEPSSSTRRSAAPTEIGGRGGSLGANAAAWAWPWLRPRDWLSEATLPQGAEPTVFVGSSSESDPAAPSRCGISPDDVCQGHVGDCWLLSSLSALATAPDALQRVFRRCWAPSITAADVAARRRAGAYDLRLCVGGWWSNVVVDDWFPCAGRLPAFTRNHAEPHELWAPLEGDDDGEFKRLVDHVAAGSLVGEPAYRERCTEAGLNPGHGYTVLDARRVQPETDAGRRRWPKGIRLVRLRNPWGTTLKWKG
eukprot:gene17354-44327_t